MPRSAVPLHAAADPATVLSPAEIERLPWTWAADEWSRSALAWTRLLGACLDAQSVWWRDAEAWCWTALRVNVQAAEQAGMPSFFGLPTELAPSSVLQRMRTDWLAGNRAWLEALEHDLQPNA